MFAFPSFDRVHLVTNPAARLSDVARPSKPGKWVGAAALAIAFGLGFAPVSAAPKENPASTPDAKVDGATYYLTQRVSVTREAGVSSVPTGTEVTLVGPVKDGMKVKLSDGTELVTASQQLTQDPALAQRLAERDQAQSAAAAAAARARAEALIAAEAARSEADIAAAQSSIRRVQDTAASASAAPRPSGMIGSSLDINHTVVATMHPKKRKKK
jgi:hypothetical protein